MAGTAREKRGDPEQGAETRTQGHRLREQRRRPLLAGFELHERRPRSGAIQGFVQKGDVMQSGRAGGKKREKFFRKASDGSATGGNPKEWSLFISVEFSMFSLLLPAQCLKNTFLKHSEKKGFPQLFADVEKR